MKTEDGWRLEGAAAFQQEGEPVSLVYRLGGDPRWHTREGAIEGWWGERPVAFHVSRSSEGNWTLNGRPVSEVARCMDLDFGFTPATNLFQIRRIALQEGEAADVPAAWLDVGSGVLEVLDQRYERRSDDLYWYEGPRFHYAAMLRVRPSGFVEQYPDLWTAERPPE